MYNKVLVPLDGSELAECALEHVIRMFKDGSIREITILNVVEADVQWAGMDGGGLDIFKIRDVLIEGSGKYLAGVAARLGAAGIQARTEVLEGGRPAGTICEYARKSGTDLIAMATHGYSGLKKLMFGSVAYALLHEAHIPVLMIRPGSGEGLQAG